MVRVRSPQHMHRARTPTSPRARRTADPIRLCAKRCCLSRGAMLLLCIFVPGYLLLDAAYQNKSVKRQRSGLGLGPAVTVTVSSSGMPDRHVAHLKPGTSRVGQGKVRGGVRE